MEQITINTDFNLFDIMAKIFIKINSLSETDKENIFKRSQSDFLNLEQVIEDRFPFINGREADLYYDAIDCSNILHLSSYIDRENGYDCFQLLLYLDHYINFEQSIKRFFDSCVNLHDKVWLFKSLNNNAAGILLPRFIPIWAKKQNVTRATCNCKPFSLIHHYIWCADSDEIEVDHIYVDVNPLEKNIIDEPFRIVCSPLTDSCPFHYEYGKENGINYFFVDKYYEDIQEIVIDRIKKTLCYASKMQATIVFFPEMMISPENRETIVQIIKDNWEYIYPRIVFFPSSEYKEGDIWKNQIVVANDLGNILYKYNKQRAYRHPDKNKKGEVQGFYFEPISRDNNFTILHLNNIGRVGILICADIFDDIIQEKLCNKYDLDMIFVAACTSGWDLFNRCSNGMWVSFCEVIVCNTCSVINKGNRDSVYPVAYYSNGHNSKREYPIKICENECKGCAVCIEISSVYRDKNSNPLTLEFF